MGPKFWGLIIVLAIVASMEGMMLSLLAIYYASNFAQPVRDIILHTTPITALLFFISISLSGNAYHKALRLYGSERDERS